MTDAQVTPSTLSSVQPVICGRATPRPARNSSSWTPPHSRPHAIGHFTDCGKLVTAKHWFWPRIQAAVTWGPLVWGVSGLAFLVRQRLRITARCDKSLRSSGEGGA